MPVAPVAGEVVEVGAGDDAADAGDQNADRHVVDAVAGRAAWRCSAVDEVARGRRSRARRHLAVALRPHREVLVDVATELGDDIDQETGVEDDAAFAATASPAAARSRSTNCSTERGVAGIEPVQVDLDVAVGEQARRTVAPASRTGSALGGVHEDGHLDDAGNGAAGEPLGEGVDGQLAGADRVGVDAALVHPALVDQRRPPAPRSRSRR